MRTTRQQFEKDFKDYLEYDLFIEHECLEYTIFILQDGTPINSTFEFGCRCTDHNSVLQEKEYNMSNMVTIEPERHAIMVDTTQLTEEQLNTMQGYSNMWDDIIFYDIENDCITEQVNDLLIQNVELTTAIEIAMNPDYLE